jgi:glycosyltransferase involved in cell wall biosynthesis
MVQSPLVSVVLCTYNGSLYLGEQLSSILLQSHKNIEVIIVDDCSTDNTVEIVKEFQRKDSRIQLFVNSINLGYNKNFEQALGLANADYFAISDQDDVWHEKKIELLMQLWSDSSILIVAGRSASFTNVNSPSISRLKLKKPFNGNDARCFFLQNHIAGHNMILSRRLLKWAAPFPQSIYYDWWLAVVACSNGNIRGSEDVLVHHRIHSSNASTVSKDVSFHSTVVNRLPFLLSAPNLPTPYKVFGEVLVARFLSLKHQSFSISLFLLLLKYSRVIFFYKRKFFPYFSYFKHSIKLASASTKAF